MRKFVLGLAMLATIAVACAPEEDPPPATGDGTPTAPADAAGCAESASTVQDGALTIGTGNPAFPPWFAGGETDEHPEWEFDDPYSGKGYESAVLYAVADELGFTTDQVEWIPVGFNKSFAPGPKDFDFVLQQISYSDKRAQAVDFSESYYDVNQALVANEGSSVADATTIEELKDATLGAPIGTTSLTYIEENIQPNPEPQVYEDLAGAFSDLDSGQIDGVVADLPTAFIAIAIGQVKDGVLVGQFPTVGQQEYFAMAFEKGNMLVDCVNLAIEKLKSDGTLASLQQKWLSDKASAPVIAA